MPQPILLLCLGFFFFGIFIALLPSYRINMGSLHGFVRSVYVLCECFRPCLVVRDLRLRLMLLLNAFVIGRL
jgi:hypothetical protein